MGMIAKRERVQLDNNIVSGLATDDVARKFVQDLRRNGAQIMISPGVIREIARSARPIRERLVKAATEYCDGFTNLPFQQMLEMEIKAMNRGEEISEILTLPISELKKLLNDEFAAKTATALDVKYLRRSIIEMLDRLGSRKAREELFEPGFEAFLKSWSSDLFRVVINSAVKIGCPKPVLRPEGSRVHHDKHALAVAVALMAANNYRKLTGEMLKGEGCFSDIWNVMEVAHSDKLLTRDKELFESGKLVRSVLSDTGPEIVLVPQP